MSRLTEQKSGCLPILLLFMLLMVVLLFGYYRISSKVTTIAGKPDPRLSFFQRVRQTFLIYQSSSLISSPNTLNTEIKFDIDIAEPVGEICARLESQSAVRNGKALCSYLIYKGLDRDLQAGQFTIIPHTTIIQVAERISNPRLKDVLFTIYPGWRLEEVAEAILLAGFPAGADEVTFAFRYPMNNLLADLGIPANTSLEGYLCPDNYALKPETQLTDLVEKITACHLKLQSQPKIITSLKEIGFSYHQAITLASIIQRETLDAPEMPMIASVFFNRLAQGMMLQTDPTIQYALGFDEVTKTWWKSPLTTIDLEVGSPYNTYQVFGLPPGPISTPSMDAILAVAQPAQSDFLYFRAKCDGSLTHVFSHTYEEHLSNACP